MMLIPVSKWSVNRLKQCYAGNTSKVWVNLTHENTVDEQGSQSAATSAICKQYMLLTLRARNVTIGFATSRLVNDGAVCCDLANV